ncbi:ArnT family glycosyltransferase [Pedobacter soli]|uniref:Dolichyl-phosphate-mannose-protein mannosyltransferase n=1 Tax=Pedobacter soli TaxID=390242 RepID=A0A1G6YR08_9SPHI|nr:glycosyltransferase family 39 protein [Pedobacter soli]SDD92740.1 Dolichyl-phosphate-mannose-protein mannosyltransferase [Pedobacter soli]
MTIKTKLIILIFTATLIRCIAAIAVDLGNDEVYYLSYAHHLQWNYFDHPPMVALLIRLTTFNLHFTDAFFVRLGPIILAAINTLLIFNIVRKLKDETAGFIAALLFTASVYCSVIAGLFILPDAPQIFFWLIGIGLLIASTSPNITRSRLNLNLILFGVVAGLCTMSKVHGIFLWFGLLLYAITTYRKLLLNRYFYLAGLITAVIVSPVLIWNIHNKFITYSFHSSRVTLNHGIHLLGFARELLGSILYNNPINYLLIFMALIAISRKQSTIKTQTVRLLIFTSIPLILILLFTSLFRDTLPHWSGPAYIALIMLTACHFSADTVKSSLQLKLAYAASIFLALIVSSGILLVNYFPGTIGKQDKETLGSGDFTLDMYGWKGLKNEFNHFRQRNISAGISSTSFIISNKWFPGAHIDNYVAQPLGLNFIAIGQLEDIHTYAWLNRYRKQIKNGDDAYFITFSNNFSDPNPLYSHLFRKITKAVSIPQLRYGKPVRNILIFLLMDYRGK